MFYSAILLALTSYVFRWCHDTQHNDTQHNDTQHNDIQQNNELNTTLSIMTLSFMLSVIYAKCCKNPFMLRVIILSVVAPFRCRVSFYKML